MASENEVSRELDSALSRLEWLEDNGGSDADIEAAQYRVTLLYRKLERMRELCVQVL